MVEHRLPKPVVAGSIPVSRSTISRMFSLRRRVLSILSKTLWKNEPRIDSRLLGNEEPVLTAHRFVFDIGFLRLAGSGCASMLTAAESELLKCWCSYVTLDTTEPLTHAMRFEESHGFAPSGRSSIFSVCD
jgi:hypothetical protein